jgi:hypothetical protein
MPITPGDERGSPDREVVRAATLELMACQQLIDCTLLSETVPECGVYPAGKVTVPYVVPCQPPLVHAAATLLDIEAYPALLFVLLAWR